jgi:hypothetical protein
MPDRQKGPLDKTKTAKAVTRKVTIIIMARGMGYYLQILHLVCIPIINDLNELKFDYSLK